MNGNRYYCFTKSDGALPIAADQVEFFALDTVKLDDDQSDVAPPGARALDARSGRSASTTIRSTPRGATGLRRSACAPGWSRSFCRTAWTSGSAATSISTSGSRPWRRPVLHVSGAGGALRRNDISPTGWTAAGFDDDTHFMLMEIAGDMLYFLAISRKGETIDSGALKQRDKPKPPGTIGR